MITFIAIFMLYGCQTEIQHQPPTNALVNDNKIDSKPSLPSSNIDKAGNAETAPAAGGLPDPRIDGPMPLPFPYDLIMKGGSSGGSHEFDYVHFVPNLYSFWTNPRFATKHLIEDCMGNDCECEAGEENCEAIPAFANIITSPTNFVMCKGGPYAVCYYSGSEDESIDLSCELTEDGRFANCKCFLVPWGAYLVDINAILNYEVYKKTIEVCGVDGSDCSDAEDVNKAPVCKAINENTLIPEADVISVFSFSCVPSNGLGQTNCPENVYAGCMTAPCQTTATEGIVECSCPTFDGPYQVGTTLSDVEECILGEDLVWSAAFNPAGSTIPPTSPCIPDAPGGNGCPLYDNSMTPPINTDCEAICEAYACINNAGIESAFTCDATLCTGECNDRNLLEVACQGLKECSPLGLAAIAQLEADVECSCCASQLCGCTPSPVTNRAIYDLNAAQRDVGIIPQCDVNGTLCGSPCAQNEEGCD